VRRDVLVREQHGEQRRGHAGDRFDDLRSARASPAVTVGAGPIPVEGEDPPTLVLGKLALLLLDVLEVGELIDAGEQPVEFLLDLAGASFDLSDPRELIRFEELGTPGRCAGNEARTGLAPAGRSQPESAAASQTSVQRRIGSFAILL
jgi:hypothetical protein